MDQFVRRNNKLTLCHPTNRCAMSMSAGFFALRITTTFSSKGTVLLIPDEPYLPAWKIVGDRHPRRRSRTVLCGSCGSARCQRAAPRRNGESKLLPVACCTPRCTNIAIMSRSGDRGVSAEATGSVISSKYPSTMAGLNRPCRRHREPGHRARAVPDRTTCAVCQYADLQKDQRVQIHLSVGASSRHY
jgi:hypothetical protein